MFSHWYIIILLILKCVEYFYFSFTIVIIIYYYYLYVQAEYHKIITYIFIHVNDGYNIVILTFKYKNLKNFHIEVYVNFYINIPHIV